MDTGTDGTVEAAGDASPESSPPPKGATRGHQVFGTEQRLFGLKPGVGALEMVAAGIVLLVPLLNLPIVDQGPWAFRTALVLIVMGPALVLLVDLARRGDRAAQCAVGFIVVAALSAALSASPRISFIGGYGVDRGVLVLAGYLGCWAIGRRVHPDAHQLLVTLFIAVVLVNVAWGVLQVLWGQQLGLLGVVDGRAAGFTASSVYLGGLVAGALGAVGFCASSVELRSRTFALLLVAAAALGMGANLTGSRIALVGGVVVAVAAVVRKNWRAALLLLAAMAIGVAISLAIPEHVSTTNRIGSDSSAGVGPRTIMWDAGLHALAHRPLLGWGPGDFRAATSSRVTAKFVIEQGQDQVLFDAHNVFVEQLTTVGIIGFLVLAAWIALASRRARGPLAWLALGIAVTWLLEPVSISTAPVALLALGAAAPPIELPRLSIAWRSVAATLAVVGVIAGSLVLIVTRDMKAAIGPGNGSPSALADAQRLFPRDGTLDSQALQFAEQRYHTLPSTPANQAVVLAAARKAVSDDSGRPDYWDTVAVVAYQFKMYPTARAAYIQSLKLDPYGQAGLVGLAEVASVTHDKPLLASTNTKLCQIRSEYCDHV